MEKRDISTYSLEDAVRLFGRSADAIIMVDAAEDTYHAVVRNGIFKSFINENGFYKGLILNI